jgi:membrane protein
VLRRLFRFLGVLRESLWEFFRDDCPRLAAALAFYALFWLPALLVLLVGAAGLVSEGSAVEDYVLGELAGWIGPRGVAVVRAVIARIAATPFPGGSTTIGLVSLLVGATGALAQLQAALDRAWGVQASRRRVRVGRFFVRRALALVVLLGLWGVLMLSLAVRAAVAGYGEVLVRWLSSDRSRQLLLWLDGILFLAACTAACAVLFRVLPDARVRWRHVWVGAFASALLFTGGKALVGTVLGRGGFASLYGAAGSLALVLVWVYYSALAVLFGAELARVWARRHGG